MRSLLRYRVVQTPILFVLLVVGMVFAMAIATPSRVLNLCLAGLYTILFTLKVTDQVSWSWWWVAAPALIAPAGLVGMLILGWIHVGLSHLFDNKLP